MHLLYIDILYFICSDVMANWCICARRFMSIILWNFNI